MIAVALSPQARALIQAHRHARRPTAADRERVTTALRAQLGTSALPLETPMRSRLSSNGAQNRSAAALGMCVVGSVLFLAERALATLEEHQRRFSASVLKDERNAAKARARCKLHRFSEGGATLALLARETPLAARAKEDCESASSRADTAFLEK